MDVQIILCAEGLGRLEFETLQCTRRDHGPFSADPYFNS